MLEAEITTSGDVLVEGQHVGSLQGFRFTPDPQADGPDAKAIGAVAQKALAGEIERRAEKIGNAPNPEFVLSTDGTLRWLGAPVARIVATDDALRPRLVLLADEGLTGPARERVQDRVDIWLKSHVETLLKPLFELLAGVELSGPARGIAFRLVEGQGVLERSEIAEEIKALDQEARSSLRKLGVRFGAYHIYVPALLKPAPSALNAMLWALKNQGLDAPGLAELPQLSATGRTTVPVDPSFARPLYRVVGYRIAGNRAVRIDILERLADIIRPLIAWKPTSDNLVPPEGAVDGNGFTITVAMTSLLGCSGEDFAGVLKSLGYRLDRRPAPPKAAPEPAPVAEVPATEVPATEVAADIAEAAPVAEPVVETSAETPAEIIEAAAPEAATEAAPAEETATAEPVAETAAEIVEVTAPEVEANPVVETTVETASVETTEIETTAEATSETVIEAAAPAEPEMIDVWRPGRFDRRPQQRDHRRDRRPNQASATTDAAASEGKPEGRDGRGRQQDGEREGRRQGRPQQRGPRPERGDRPQGEGRRNQDRPDHRNKGGDFRQGQAQQPRRDEPRRDRPVDPNSPFAALLALKADLEAKKRGS